MGCQKAATLVSQLRRDLLDMIASKTVVENELTEEVQTLNGQIETAQAALSDTRQQAEARAVSRSGRRTNATNFHVIAGGRRTENTADIFQIEKKYITNYSMTYLLYIGKILFGLLIVLF